jgi:hypothetical protein
MLRQESANLDKDGRPIVDRAEDIGNAKYGKGFTLLSNWIESNLDIYKVRAGHARLRYVRTNQLYRLSYDDYYGRYSFTHIWTSSGTDMLQMQNPS